MSWTHSTASAKSYCPARSGSPASRAIIVDPVADARGADVLLGGGHRGLVRVDAVDAHVGEGFGQGDARPSLPHADVGDARRRVRLQTGDDVRHRRDPLLRQEVGERGAVDPRLSLVQVLAVVGVRHPVAARETPASSCCSGATVPDQDLGRRTPSGRGSPDRRRPPRTPPAAETGARRRTRRGCRRRGSPRSPAAPATPACSARSSRRASASSGAVKGPRSWSRR